LLSEHRAQYTKLKVIIHSTTVSNLALLYGTVVIKFRRGAHLSILNVNIEHHGAAHGRG